MLERSCIVKSASVPTDNASKVGDDLRTDSFSGLNPWYDQRAKYPSEAGVFMADDRDLYRFVIKAYSPDRIPMSRLAEYMSDLADLLGEKTAVHFVRLEEGSTALAYRVEPEAKPKVRDRVHALTFREAPVEALRAFDRLDRRLRLDNGFGYIAEPDGATVIEFPGVRRLTHQPYSAFWQPGHLSGVVVLVGSKRGLVPARDRKNTRVAVHIEDGERTYNCIAKRSFAARLGTHLFSNPIRVTGRGRWERGADGVWTLLEFRIEDFSPLDPAPLRSVVERLRAIPGVWKEDTDTLKKLATIKGTDEEVEK
jgi:hypothetical protein